MRARPPACPTRPRLHLFVARGSVDLEGAGRLEEGDAARLAVDGAPALTATTPAEVLVWQLAALERVVRDISWSGCPDHVVTDYGQLSTAGRPVGRWR